ncbi:ferrous iron transport protein B [Desulfosarcina ovata subsp. sediminis]|uniref:Ferrous iron transport protein B n=1 Tax=Desulfosarcina ovata subsp. sediminis TaxID=885957 RepID=A0A5K8A1D4_9BACT|nr:ferrous iron transport protein B [Desulfosarcina ovata]BBO86369.1 ferrous iron transport protein B [Desulfosarcina ovata subsp. sediminis]
MDICVALGGNPNAGKTTLFNALTGSRQHVGNYPGVTVDRKEGRYVQNGHDMHIVDLPGTYSLTAYSVEEVVARDFLVNECPQVTINIVDASNLERNLYLTIQFLELGIPTCVALNMIDVARSRGIEVDHQKLTRLLGVPVIPIVARSGLGKQALMDAVARVAEAPRPQPLRVSYGRDLETAIQEMEPLISENAFLTAFYPTRWIALKYLENDAQILEKGRSTDRAVSDQLEAVTRKVSAHIEETLETYPEAMIADHRYGFISSLLKQGILKEYHDRNRLFLSDRIDKVLVNRFAGPLIMFGVLFALYQFVFTYSEVPVGWCETFFEWLADTISGQLADGLLKSLIVSGIIDGVGGVLGFVPLILFMFFGIAILEDSGYLARVAFMLDRVFQMFGLHGSSVMAYIVSGGIAGGCAVPGVMATRTLRSPKERIATLLTAPFMNCGAKLPVFALLIAAFFPAHQARMMFILTLISWSGALLAAKFLRLTVVKGPSTPFVMELPPYRLPTFRGLMIHTWERTWQYVKKAGTVILGISVLLWAAMTFPRMPDGQIETYAAQRSQIIAAAPAAAVAELEQPLGDSPLSSDAARLKSELLVVQGRQSAEALRHSLAGRIGSTLEVVSRWAGFDWRTNIALLGGFAAKEVIVSTLGTAYSLGDVDAQGGDSLSARLVAEPGWRVLTAWSVIIFVMFYAPCFITVVCISRESSWRWGLFSMVFNTSLAFLLAVGIYQVGSALGY